MHLTDAHGIVLRPVPVSDIQPAGHGLNPDELAVTDAQAVLLVDRSTGEERRLGHLARLAPRSMRVVGGEVTRYRAWFPRAGVYGWLDFDGQQAAIDRIVDEA